MIQWLRSLMKQEQIFWGIAPALMWQTLFFIVPLAFVITLACVHVSTGVWSLYNIKQVLVWSHVQVILRSLLVANVTAWGCLLLGYPVAYFVALRVTHFKFVFVWLLSLPFMVNLLVQVYAWFFLLDAHGLLNKSLYYMGLQSYTGALLNSSFAIYLVMIHVFLPFMIMPIYTVLEKFDTRLIEASKDLGASYKQTWYRVILPLSMPGIQAGFFLVYVMAFGEYVIPSLMGGNRYFYTGTLIAEYFFIGKDWHTGSAFTVVASGILFITAIAYYMFFRYISRWYVQGGRS